MATATIGMNVSGGLVIRANKSTITSVVVVTKNRAIGAFLPSAVV